MAAVGVSAVGVDATSQARGGGNATRLSGGVVYVMRWGGGLADAVMRWKGRCLRERVADGPTARDSCVDKRNCGTADA